MVAISHVLWTTGRTLDLQPIADAVHAVGGLLLIDGAQSAGNIAVDVAATGADAYAFSGQKWLLGPLGSGALWVSPELTQRIWPVTSGYLNLEGGEIGKFKTTAGRLDGGTNDPATVAGLLRRWSGSRDCPAAACAGSSRSRPTPPPRASGWPRCPGSSSDWTAATA